MSFRRRSSGAAAPAEVQGILNEHQPLGCEDCWHAVPSSISKSNEKQRIASAVEIDRVLGELPSDVRLGGTLRSMDVLNGCYNQCDTCLADAPLPSKMISFDSITRLFSDSQFLHMLQPDSLRFGSSGDILDHPQAIEILEGALDATSALDYRRQKLEQKRHTIKVYTNYRPAKEETLDKLLDLLVRRKERLAVAVSLPLNRLDTINNKFLSYAKTRPRFFRIGTESHCDGYPVISGAVAFGELKLSVWDVAHPDWLLSTGRVLAPSVLKNKAASYRRLDRFRGLEVEQRGFAKTYLNPDGLWLMVYATAYESHTSRLFTLINETNIEWLSRIPFHPDFPAPQSWTGGTAPRRTFSQSEVVEKEYEYKRTGRPKRALTVVR